MEADGVHEPTMEEIIAERDRLLETNTRVTRENEELMRRGEFDPNRPLREFTAPNAENIRYRRPVINAPYVIPDEPRGG